VTPPEQISAAGIDGCRAGWVAAVAFGRIDESARTALQLFADVDQVVSWRSAQRGEPIIAIDVPIGLPRAAGLRECDRQARAALGSRRACVFEVPDRELIGQGFEAARQTVRRRREAQPGKAFRVLTRQAVNIAGRIAEVDRVLCRDRSQERWLVEVHPEVSFRELAGEELPSKKTPAGKKRRLGLLRRQFPDIAREVRAAPWRRGQVAYDDMLDAYAALWSALRFSRGSHRELGNGHRDEHGLLERVVV
jgi:predicted RNase H-like nuclease